ncbi:MAG: TIGR03915 family putative DNA repair protein [Candidatus Gastranaerophilales bacterium]|nr:TIGR03915 family putative DNA repair protein [Candidatus Gastranaerophilales bacterium]
MGMVVYQCEDSMESIFTAIYRAYEDKRRPEDTIVSLTDESFLFAEHVPVEADGEKAKKVAKTLWREFGEDDYYRICMALTAPDAQKGQAVYQTIAAGLRGRCRRGRLFDDLRDDNIRKAFALARGADREYGHQREFLRFQEVEPAANVRRERAGDDRKILYARIGLKCQVMSFLMEHFADRFPRENFMIYDERWKLMGIHPTERQMARGEGQSAMTRGKEQGSISRMAAGGADLLTDGRTWYLIQCEDDFAEADRVRQSEREQAYQELFTYFCHKIAIRERRNLELQKNLLPLRFREYMTEFQRMQSDRGE